MKSEFAEQILKLAQAQGNSQSDIARAINRPPQQVNRYITGKGDITANNLISILKALGINLEEIIERRIKNLNKETTNINDSIIYMYEQLDNELRKMILNSLIAANKVTGTGKLPDSVIRIVESEMNPK